MMRIRQAAVILVLFGVITAGVFGSGRQEEEYRVKVVTTTSLIEQVVERIGKDKVEVINIIPPAQCPGHFDAKPRDIQKLADADLFILHGWQGEKFSQQLISSANNPGLTVVRIDINGNWMVPAVQRQAADVITDALIQADPGGIAYYEDLSTRYKEIITAKETELKTELEKMNLAHVNVLCAEMQAGFIKWTGCHVVAAYGRPDSFTPGVIGDLVDMGKAEGVSLIIDNIQSGEDAGAAIAEELSCRRLVLSNFPGGFAGTETWEKAIDFNIGLIAEAVGR